MEVTYTVNGQPFSLQLDSDDLRELLINVDRQVREKHEEVRENPDLIAVIADGLLNSLAADAEMITLGELGITRDTSVTNR